jgi:hypothetical protein
VPLVRAARGRGIDAPAVTPRRRTAAPRPLPRSARGGTRFAREQPSNAKRRARGERGEGLDSGDLTGSRYP